MKNKILYIEENKYISETFIKHEKSLLYNRYNLKEISLIDIKLNLFRVLLNLLNQKYFKVKILCFKLFISSLNDFNSFKSNTKIIFLFLSLDLNKIKSDFSDISHIRAHFIAKRAYFALFLAELLNISFSSVAHADDIFSWHKSKELIIKRSAFIHCISNYNIGFINAKTNFKFSEKLKLIYNSFNLINSNINLKIKTSHTKLEFLFIGRIIEKKGLLEFTKLFAKMNITNSIFTIIGSGPFESKIREFVDNNDLSDKVTFKGNVNNSDSIKLLMNSDFLVITSLNANNAFHHMDGIPTVIFEALSNGIPVITTQVSGIPEFLYDNVNGLIIDDINNESAEDLKNKIKNFDNSPEIIAKLFKTKYKNRAGGLKFLDELQNLGL